jgi:hypothetical protein
METKTNTVALGTQLVIGPVTRDRELVHFVARFGAVDIEHAKTAIGVGRSAAYRRVAELADAGLLERLALLRREPSLIRATREGLRYAGLAGLPVAVVRPGGAEHYRRCVDVGLRLERDFGDGSCLRVHAITDRELALAERVEGRPLASARLALNGHEALHRPDLALFGDSGVVAIEVELSAKAPRRLEAIIRAWRRAEHVDEVRYYCAPGTTTWRAVERAVEKTYADEKVRLLELPR